MTVTKSKFTYRVDRWNARGDTILDHIGGLDELEVATAAYEAACKRWPREPITLRQGTRVIEDSRRKREPYEPRIFEGRVMLPEEIQRIHQEIVSFERIEAISDPMRELIEDLWPELVLAVAFVSYGPIKSEFDAVASISKAEWPVQLAGFRERYPQYNHLSDAQLMDAFYKKFYSDLTREEFDKRMASAKSVDPENFAQLEKAVADIRVPDPWATLGTWAGIAFGIPLAVLALGASLLWALSGFAAEHQS